MSNVKVNGNTYNEVSSVRLPLADGTGYATFTEGAVVDDVTTKLLGNDELDDRTFEGVTYANMFILNRRTFGSITYPDAVTVAGQATNAVGENLYFPKVVNFRQFTAGQNEHFRSTKISGVLDLYSIQTCDQPNQTFMGAEIGTLKLGKFKNANMVFSNAKITNLVWNNPDINASAMGGNTGLGCSGATITNAYVPDSLYDEIKALKDAGSLTTVTNLYKISEWSD